MTNSGATLSNANCNLHSQQQHPLCTLLLIHDLFSPPSRRSPRCRRRWYRWQPTKLPRSNVNLWTVHIYTHIHTYIVKKTGYMNNSETVRWHGWDDFFLCHFLIASVMYVQFLAHSWQNHLCQSYYVWDRNYRRKQAFVQSNQPNEVLPRNSISTSSWLIKMNILSLIEPISMIREGISKNFT